MIFGRRRLRQMEKAGKGYQGKAWRQFSQNRQAKWSLRILYVMFFVAIFGDFIANDKPIYAVVEDQTRFPVFESILANLGLANAGDLNTKRWDRLSYTDCRVIWPLIPFGASSIDMTGLSKPPLFKSRNENCRASWQNIHWFGTDQIGRDLAAGLVSGTRIALMVGLLSMFIASIIGVTLGSVAGYFGDQSVGITLFQVIVFLLLLFLGFFWAWSSTFFVGSGVGKVLSFCGFVAGGAVLGYFLARLFRFHRNWNPRFNLPVDILVMRLIEVINGLPGLLILLALVAVVEQPTTLTIAVIVGLISWTGIARFMRAEVLRIQGLEYVQAGRALGFNHVRILVKHILPNAISPVLVAIAFGIASAILLEASLSFLGLGLPAEEVTWGRLLYAARSSTNSWWLAVFPGMAIFISVSIFNFLGEGLALAISGRTTS